MAHNIGGPTENTWEIFRKWARNLEEEIARENLLGIYQTSMAFFGTAGLMLTLQGLANEKQILDDVDQALFVASRELKEQLLQFYKTLRTKLEKKEEEDNG